MATTSTSTPGDVMPINPYRNFCGYPTHGQGWTWALNCPAPRAAKLARPRTHTYRDATPAQKRRLHQRVAKELAAGKPKRSIASQLGVPYHVVEGIEKEQQQRADLRGKRKAG